MEEIALTVDVLLAKATCRCGTILLFMHVYPLGRSLDVTCEQCGRRWHVPRKLVEVASAAELG